METSIHVIDGGAHGIPALASELVDIALPCDASPASEFQSSNDSLFPLLALPGAQARRAKIRNIGYGVRSDFELNFDRYLPSLGRADDDTDAKPE